MGLGDRISRLVRANITDWKNQNKDYQKELQQTLRELRQSVNEATASQQRLQREYHETQQQIATLLEQTKHALQQNNEQQAREILTRKQSQSKIADRLKERLDELAPTVANLQRHLFELENYTNFVTANAASQNIEKTLAEMPEVDFAEIDAQLDLLRSRLDRF